MRYESVYLTCSKKLTDSQLTQLPHGTNKKYKRKTKKIKWWTWCRIYILGGYSKFVENASFSYRFPFHLTYMITEPLDFSPKILIQTVWVPVPKLLDVAKILSKSSTHWIACNNVTDRQTVRRGVRGP